jgi:hypothetical protein
MKKFHNDPRLIELTNKFLADFFDIYHEEQVQKHAEEPKLYSDKRDDGFVFGYVLPKAILCSDHVQAIDSSEVSSPLMSWGFVDNITKGFFKHHTQDTYKDLEYILENFNDQEEYDDYRAENLQVEESSETKKELNFNYLFGENKGNEEIKYVDKTTVTLIKSFEFLNTKSSFRCKVNVKYKNGRLSSTTVQALKGQGGYSDNPMVLRISYSPDFGYKANEAGEQEVVVTSYEETPEIEHFRYTPEINGFYYMVNQVHCGIKMFQKRKKNKSE